MKHPRSLLRFCITLVTVWLALCTVIGIVAVELALHPGKLTLTSQAETIAQSVAARNHAELADVFIIASDGVTLRAWSIRPLHGNGDAVILLHGVSDNRSGMLGYADLLSRHGYTVLLPDARAHGVSGGDLATYGVKEADDTRRWFNWLQRTESPRCIDGLGESMGAALLLQSLRTTPGFCAVVAESSFASFREASYERLGQALHTGPWIGRTLLHPAVDAAFLYARWRYGVDFSEASPEDAVAQSHVPVLLIHGLKDTNMPPRHAHLIVACNPSRNPSRNPQVVLWQPREAGHCGAASAEPAEFERRVLGWFQSHD